MNSNKIKFAVILSGCGNKDGAEIHESVLTLLAIDQANASYQCFAPDMHQTKVINFISGEEMPETRNVLIESARIARGDIKPLEDFDATQFDILVIPGGFGAALNLSTFAIDGSHMSVQKDVSRAVKSMAEAKKPIGALCIAPVILGKLLNDVTLTFGQASDVNAVFEDMGVTVKNTSHGEIVIDETHKIVTTPCYMLEASIKDIALGTSNLIQALIKLK